MPPDVQKRLELNNIDEEYILKQKKQLLDKYDNNEEITDSYCKFQEISSRYGDDKWINKLFLDPGIYAGLCSNSKEYFLHIIEGTPFKTLAGLKNEEYIISNKNDTEIIVKAELLEKLNKTELERLLILHEALKNERNNINHASDKVIRLPLKIVKKAVQEYIEIYRSLSVADEDFQIK